MNAMGLAKSAIH